MASFTGGPRRSSVAILVGLSLLCPVNRSLAGASSEARAAQGSPLKIVVIEGENAVNIIQQKTAVRPLVEVRDQNDLPVSGATVTFTITGGKTATFAGAQSVSVTTNAAGRAAVSALNPVSNGAVRIQVQAAFQGQTATTTIAQTNFATAAQAAQSTSAAGSGGTAGAGAATGTATAAGTAAGGGTGAAAGAGAAGGGGLSTGAIVGIVGGVIGGVVAAKEVTGGGDDGAGGAPAPPVTRAVAGQFSGEVLLTFGLGFCTRLESMRGTLQMTLALQPDRAVGGGNAFLNNGVLEVVSVSSNCVGGPQPGGQAMMFFIPVSPIAVAGANLTFSAQTINSFQDTPTSPVGTNIMSWSFSGTVSGDTVSGSLSFVRRIESGTVTSGGSTTFPVTLRP